MIDIAGFEDSYAIDEHGNVWDKRRQCWKAKVKNNCGYWFVVLSKNGKQYSRFIHKLLAEAYIPNPENKPTVDHIDRNRENNDLSNLRWATRSEQNYNSNHESRKGTPAKNKIKTAMLDEETNEIIRIFDSRTEAAKYVNGHNSLICRVLSGKKKSAYGYKWKNIEQ